MFHVARHDRIPLHNSILKWDDDPNVHDSVANSLSALRHSIHTPEISDIQNAAAESNYA
jgi:hypothetical protein